MAEKKCPEISVIVPVYKVEKYLNECINSILAQTFAQFELILVDDGSPDGCPALCDAAALRDDRVRVIHQKNKGLSAAILKGCMPQPKRQTRILWSAITCALTKTAQKMQSLKSWCVQSSWGGKN